MKFDDCRTEWRIESIERALNQKVESHEIYSLRNDVDRLEHQLREACARIDGLCSQLEATQNQLDILQSCG